MRSEPICGQILRFVTISIEFRNRHESVPLTPQLEARQSWTVTGAKLAAAGPWAVVLLLSMRPEAAEAYRTTTGMMVLGAGLVVSILCYQLMLRIGALPAEERVLV